MASSVRLSFLFVVSCAVHTAMATAPLAPEIIKNQVETTWFTGYNTSSITSLAQKTVATGSLAPLLNHYSLQEIFSWNNGSQFFQILGTLITTESDANTLIDAFKTDQDIYAYGYIPILEKLIATGSKEKTTAFIQLALVAAKRNPYIIQYACAFSNTLAKQRFLACLKTNIKSQLQELSLDNILSETTPTAYHALCDYETTAKITRDLTETYKAHLKELAPFFCTIIKEEKSLINKGYYVFFHSQRWDYLFVEKLYTDLWALTQHKNRPSHYLFPHVRIKGFDPLEKGPLSRTDILKYGRSTNNRQALLFVNNSLFGKYKTDRYSSSLYFFLSDSNINKHIAIKPQQVFDHYNLNKLFKKHKADIAALETWYNKAHNLGTLLIIAVPKSMISDYCFAAIPGGYKNPAAPDTLTFLEELAKSTSTKTNNEEFCIVMLDKAMDPEGGIVILPRHCAEPVAYKEFEKGYEKLINELQTEIAVA